MQSTDTLGVISYLKLTLFQIASLVFAKGDLFVMLFTLVISMLLTSELAYTAISAGKVKNKYRPLI